MSARVNTAHIPDDALVNAH